ncbi:glycoside hydrolase family 31 protein [Chitinophaga sp. sic0106]|uniref:glycoside hydrolase family 31 protein n=1 Tax=Chitinophaga sp. sic0106 TaxID=2854785 RepID=UPI001C454216|nr:glycoside hydrolase family 31 protein [Chitinophaga sp. sic0106]MBV7531553.1 glycoside hydrolase family 31 protein [Chitinophaga sp. sic0106]
MQVETSSSKYSAKHYPDAVRSWKKEGNIFYFYTTETILEVRVISDKIIRFRYASDGTFQRDFSYATSDTLEESPISFGIREFDANFEIYTNYIKVLIARDNLRITITDLEGKIINQDEMGFHWQHYLLKGGKIVYCSKLIQENEVFYGLGDKPTDLNLRGKRLENYGTDAYGYQKDTDPLYRNIPFYYGLHNGIGYGLFFDNTFRTIFDFGKERDNVCSFWARGGEMNYYFIYGPDLMEVAETYTRITGTPELPPLWALGYHQCRWSYYPEKKVRDIAAEFRKRQIPCDVIYLDIDYMDGFRCFTWNKEYFPDPVKMISDLAKDGFKVVVIIDPGIKVDPEYSIYQEGLKNNYFCKRADGALMEGDVWPGKCVFPDFTNPEVRDWWAGLFKVLAETGVRGVWNDMNEPAVFEMGTFPEDVRHDYDGEEVSHRKAHNVYGHLMSKATSAGLKKYQMPNRPFVITRSAYAGAQRWSSVWTGDNVSSWEHLWLAAVQCQRLAVSGLSFCGSDIGGFIGEPDGELYTRWIQLASFHPLMRTHSASNETGFDQEPWSFGEKYEAIVKKFISLRYQLLPYFYTTFWQYAQNGTPMIRPLAFVAQHEADTYNCSHEFMFGDSLLISFVNEAGMQEKDLYLPKGQWYSYWDKTQLTGGQHHTVATPLESMPLFVKAGAVIPFYPEMQYTNEKQVDEMILEAYYGNTVVKSVLYEDAGDHYGYKNGQFNVIRFKQASDDTQFWLKKQYYVNYTSTYSRFRVKVYGIPFTPATVLVDGKPLDAGSYTVGDNIIELVADKGFEEIVIK